MFVSNPLSIVLGTRCLVVVEHPNGTPFSMVTEVVYVMPNEPGAGVGFELVALDSPKLGELESFVAQTPNIDFEHDGQGKNAVQSLYDRSRQLGLREREALAK